MSEGEHWSDGWPIPFTAEVLERLERKALRREGVSSFEEIWRRDWADMSSRSLEEHYEDWRTDLYYDEVERIDGRRAAAAVRLHVRRMAKDPTYRLQYERLLERRLRDEERWRMLHPPDPDVPF